MDIYHFMLYIRTFELIFRIYILCSVTRKKVTEISKASPSEQFHGTMKMFKFINFLSDLSCNRNEIMYIRFIELMQMNTKKSERKIKAFFSYSIFKKKINGKHVLIKFESDALNLSEPLE